MRPRQLWIYITIYVSIVALILFINYTAYKYQEIFSRYTNFFTSVCYQFLVFQTVLLCLVGARNSGSAIKEEVIGKSYDFFRMLPISAGRKTVGILVGKNLVVILLGAVNFALIIIFGLLGDVSGYLLKQGFFSLVSVAILANSLALLASINPKSQRKRGGLAALIIAGFFLGPFLLKSIAAFWYIDRLQIVTAKFYTIELPMLVLIGSIAIYYSCWAIVGILRRFTREDEPLFSRAGALLFMLGYEFVLLGIFYRFLVGGIGVRITCYSYWLVSLLPVLAVPLWSIRGFATYFEYCGLVREKSGPDSATIPRMLLYSNLSLALGLFVIWAGCAAGTTVIAKLELLPNLKLIFIIFSFYLFLILLLELYVVCTPLSDKMWLLLVFIAGVYAAVPPILYGIFETTLLYTHSPVGFAFGLFNEYAAELAGQDSIWVTNLLLCIIPAIIVWKRHLHILTTRQKM